VKFAREAISLVVGVLVGSLGSIAVADLNERQSLSRDLYHEWTSPEMRDAISVAAPAEERARARLRAGLDVEVADDPNAFAEELDATKRVAIFFERVYMLAGSNQLDRSLAARLLGSPARFWAGDEVDNATDRSFVFWSSHAADDDPLAAVRARAALGAQILAQDHVNGAPNRWLQLVGFNESQWERRERINQERRELDVPPQASGVPSAVLINEAEATSRIESAGYTNITGLAQNPDGTWSAVARTDGENVMVVVGEDGVQVVSRYPDP
jgi:hypothetical protein